LLTERRISLINTEKNEKIMLTEQQTVNNWEQFSTTDPEENGI
jgi:hypothetical protein